ncbi:uncharacterized protein LOC133785624 [Humulus lupulus]|uniref:uncharacterized protein LOC133785624 n=1 Tax=Humulus lupulus TaxID=3486 RepID=UPI002B4071A0|nr:uncharacterized protein LOC133785624 [Humulus lupulus]
MASNPILSLLSKELLTGENFMKWKSNINIVVISDNSKFVMTEESSEVPVEGANKFVHHKYEHWQVTNNKAKAYMLASMSNTLRTKLEDVETAFDIIEQLQEMFGHKSWQAHFEVTKKYANARMAPMMHVRDHFIKMTDYFQEVELHGYTIDEETLVGLILNNLAPTFLTFTTNYFLNKLNYGMTQLLNELQMYKEINYGPSKGGEKKAPTTSTTTKGAQAEVNLASAPKGKKRKGG